MNTLQITLIVLGLVIIFIILLYNRLVNLNNRIKNAWSNIDNQLKRRNDLIPNLVKVVKGYAAYERETLEKVIEARQKNIASTDVKENAKTAKQLSSAINDIFLLSEAYPNLKADQSFQKLQVELVGTEDKIAFARQIYNDNVQKFNTKIMVFPNNIFAKKLNFKKQDYFEVKEEEKENVEVKF